MPSLIRPAVAALLLAAGVAALPAAAQTAYTAQWSSGPLKLLDLESGELAALGEVGIQVDALALTLDGSGLYGAGQVVSLPVPPDPPPPLQLFTLDLETAEPVLINVLAGVESPTDMAFDDAGSLWLIDGGELLSVDPATAAVAGVGGSDLQAIAAWGGELWGLRKESPCDDWELVRIDPATGAGSSPVPLPQLVGECTAAMDFDGQGALWILTQRTGFPSPPPTLIYRAVDLESGVLELVHNFGTFAHDGLAIDRSRALIAVPTLGGAGALIFAALLAGAAVHSSRRHRGGRAGAHSGPAASSR